MDKFIIYIKCLYWNKILLLGYALFICGFLIPISFIYNYEMIIIGSSLIGFCKCGSHTIITYKRSLNTLLHNHCINNVDNFWYCDRVAYKWAKYEYNKLK